MNRKYDLKPLKHNCEDEVCVRVFVCMLHKKLHLILNSNRPLTQMLSPRVCLDLDK